MFEFPTFEEKMDKLTEDYLKLSKKEIKQEFSKLKHWKIVKGKLHREIEFSSFEDAISFMARASFEVAKMDHHPEWSNVYNKVVIDLITHDVDGLSNYDFSLAKSLDQIIATFKTKRKK